MNLPIENIEGRVMVNFGNLIIALTELQHSSDAELATLIGVSYTDVSDKLSILNQRISEVIIQSEVFHNTEMSKLTQIELTMKQDIENLKEQSNKTERAITILTAISILALSSAIVAIFMWMIENQ
jgi:hypothetical protein